MRAKYLDWCSARLAERFLRLTPDEIYELAQQASHATTTGARDASFIVDEMEPTASFRSIVERVTEVLAMSMPLPSFEEWEAAYREEPRRYEEELLGFWREGTEAGRA